MNETTSFVDGLLSKLGLDSSSNWIADYFNSHEWLSQFTKLGVILLIAFVVDYLTRLIIIRVIGKLVKKTKVTWDDVIFDKGVINRFGMLIAPTIIYFLLPISLVHNTFYEVLMRLCGVYITLVALRFVNSFLIAIYEVYHTKEHLKSKPLKGFLQTAQVILFVIGAILVVSIIINKSPAVLLTTLGASAAIIMLIFKDSIMGFVSGIQLSANNMLKVGDWISMPKYGADGTVIDISLNTVKVRNFDNTIVTVPPYLLVSDSFQNWRGMEESPGRRVKRAINIDVKSIKFCTPEMIEKFKQIDLLKDYINDTEQTIKEYNDKHNINNSLINGRRQTNIGVFRAYLKSYLLSLPYVNERMTCMVRQLQPTDKGVPIELYCFSTIKDWTSYENVQSDIFDHVFAVASEFDLKIYQDPSGDDFSKLLN